MKNCLIIGGGIAGLTAASILSSKNISVTLLEASPKLGGRTYSFLDNESGSVIDNGQHILMGCYNETLSFLKHIGAENNFDFQQNLKLVFLSREKKQYHLNADKLFYPINLLCAILNYDVLTFSEKLSFIGFILKLPFISQRTLKNKNVLEWLIQNNQNENSVKMFWEILCVGALNTNLIYASALVFHNILMQIFYKGNFSSTIVLPKFGLNESIVEPAEKYMTENGCKIITSEKVIELKILNKKVIEVITDKSSYTDFDFVVSAVPLYNLEKIIDQAQIGINLDLTYSTILNIHIWIDDILVKEKFYGLLNSTLHWVFIKNDHLNIVISDADYLVEKSKEELYFFCINELQKFIVIDERKIKHYKIIKEKRATFIPANEIIGRRPKSSTKNKNLFLAGDWTNTGLPSTIESAAKSGKLAAEEILKLCNYNYE
jgi:squalene-associated FAD-dependent desaturase